MSRGRSRRRKRRGAPTTWRVDRETGAVIHERQARMKEAKMNARIDRREESDATENCETFASDVHQANSSCLGFSALAFAGAPKPISEGSNNYISYQRAKEQEDGSQNSSRIEKKRKEKRQKTSQR